MNQEIKREWLEALRSGNYDQGAGYLRLRNQYCCLGVLCELAVKHGVVSSFQNMYGPVSYGKEMSEGLLPDEVVTWADLHTYNPKVLVTEPELSRFTDGVPLSSLNDTGWDFNRIADVIEQQL